jgi:TonB family protein
LKKDDREKEIGRIQQTYFPSAELTENGNLKWAEDKIEKDLIVVESGVINGKALSMPKPAYPVEARQARASGTVKVKVKINEQGNVVYACGAFNDVHKALIEASEAAAYSAKFSPTLLKDKAVKVSGNIVYNFIAPR